MKRIRMSRAGIVGTAVLGVLAAPLILPQFARRGGDGHFLDVA